MHRSIPEAKIEGYPLKVKKQDQIISSMVFYLSYFCKKSIEKWWWCSLLFS